MSLFFPYAGCWFSHEAAHFILHSDDLLALNGRLRPSGRAQDSRGRGPGSVDTYLLYDLSLSTLCPADSYTANDKSITQHMTKQRNDIGSLMD